MGRRVDRGFGVLLLLGAAGHTVGTLQHLRGTDAFLWSLGSSLAAALLAVLNLARAGRAADRPLAVVCAVGTLCWALLVVGFGVSIGNLLDPRVLMHLVASAGLVLFSMLGLARPRSSGSTVARRAGAAVPP